MVRRGRWIRGSLASVLLTMLVALCAPALAQDSAQSKQLLQDALTEFNAGRWDEAYALFKRLHEASPTARTLRGMGLSAFEARRYATAVTDLRAALNETRRPLDDEQRKEVRGVLEQADRFVARFRLQLQPADARLSVDGREPQREGSEVLLLDPGAHELLASAPGYRTASRTLDVEAGDRRELAIELEPSARPSTARHAAAHGDSAPAASADDGGGRAPIAGYVAAGAALLFAGGAVGLHLAARGAAHEVERTCQGACTPAQADHEIEESGVQTYQTLSLVGWGLAGASAVTAAVLFVLASEDDAAERDVAIAPAPGGVALMGRF